MGNQKHVDAKQYATELMKKSRRKSEIKESRRKSENTLEINTNKSTTFQNLSISSVQSLSCVQLLCNPMDCSMPGFPVHHQLPEHAQTHVHWVSDAIQPSCHIIPFSCLQSFPASGSFLMSQCFKSGGQSIGASASVLPMNIQGWFPLRLTGLIPLKSKRLSSVFSNMPQFKSINSFALGFLYGPTLTSIHDYWKNHNFDCLDLCQQSDVSAF